MHRGQKHGSLLAAIRRLLLSDSLLPGLECVECANPPTTRGFSTRGPSPNMVSLDAQRRAVVVSSDVEGATGKFLQNLLTNDVVKSFEAPRPSNGRVMYAHMLNSKGRFAHDVFVYGLGREDDCGEGSDSDSDSESDRDSDSDGDREVLVVDVARESKEQLMKVLRMYSMRSAVRIEDGSEEFAVCASLNGDTEGGRFAAFCPDPRADGALGYRGLVRRGSPRSQEGFLDGLAGDTAGYTKLRLSLGVAEGPREIPAGSVALEYNLDALHGISFNKGCYIGQELMARTHYQGQIRKRLVPFRVDGDAAYDDEIVDGDDGKTVGVVRADSVDGYGIGMMRVAKAFGAEELRLKRDGRTIEVYAPQWWPADWIER